ncbi:MAG: hypothetical protein NZM31_13185 [Gemmatales bacterium]|nr:hypothetical protein [Gemmatales bacterium]MDW8387951.1 hypothetical protein [Gemmatales bacterium]
MTSERLEALLERIAIALERLADGASRVPTTTKDGLQDVRTELNDYGRTMVPVNYTTSDPVIPSSRLLIDYLASRNIRIKSIPTPDAADKEIDSLSLFLGENYTALASILSKIKRNMQNGGTITEDLSSRPPSVISANCQFCYRLHKIAFLEEYYYRRSPCCMIHAKTTKLPRAQKFFSGQWLERFILHKLKVIHSRLGQGDAQSRSFEYLINPQIVLPSSHDFELDILAAIGRNIYWVEAKTGEYQQHITKYSRVGRILGLDPAHSFLVLTDVSDTLCEHLSATSSLSVCNLSQFESRFLSVVRSDLGALSIVPGRTSDSAQTNVAETELSAAS